MDLGAFHIPQEDWPLAVDLGLKYAFNSDVIDIMSEMKIGEYIYDDIEAPTRPPRVLLEQWAQERVDRGFEPSCSAVPSFLGSQAHQLRDWGKEQQLWIGFQAYLYEPRWWSRIDTWLQRWFTGFWMRGRKWFGITDLFYPIYAPADSWRPKSPQEIQGLIRQYKRRGASALIFYPWNQDALERALT